MLRPLLSWLLSLTVILWSFHARAHERSSGAAWVQPQGDSLQLRVEMDRQLTGELGLERPASEASQRQLLARLLQARVDGRDCAIAQSQFTETPTGAWYLVAQTAPCRGAQLQLQSPLFQGNQEERRGHLLLASVQQRFTTKRCVFGGVNTPCELSLHTAPAAPASLTTPAAPGATRSLFVAFLAHGVEHIAQGLDHLLFLALVMLGAASLRDAFWRLSAFSLGHALTLSLVALSVLTPPSRPVEVAIALSLVALGWSVISSPASAASRSRSGPGLTALFGLLHGLGFGAGLRGLGFRPEEAIPSLLGFHVGVELGQLAAAALFGGLVLWLRRRGQAWPWRRVAGAIGMALGVVWALQRLAGPA